VQALPGCHSERDTEEEAMANSREAMDLCLTSEEHELLDPPSWGL